MKAIYKSLHLILFISAVTAGCHYFFSWIGFNPTDEGFVLSAARRLIDGQVPHADFISIRPAGSSYLHAPEIMFGGDRVFELSRLVFWLQHAFIAWFWVIIADKLLSMKVTILNRYMLAAVIFIFNSHIFPPMAWTTVDGLFLSTIGIWLLTHFNKRGNQLGYILLGCAALCKQNFLVMIPGVFIIMGHFKRPYYLLDAMTPILLYILLLWRNDAVEIAFEQLFSRREIVETGVMRYLKSPGFFAGLAIPICINIFRSKYKSFLRNIDFILAFSLSILGAAAMVMDMYIGDFSFALFGFVCGYSAVHLKRRYALVYCTLALLTAWTVSISLGYNTPALASGILLGALLSLNYDRELFQLPRRIKYPIAVLVMAGILIAYGYARYQYVYKDDRAGNLTAELGEALAGGQGILTNVHVAGSLGELRELQSRYGDSLAVVPDYAAFWVKSPYPNPLIMDWPNINELADSTVRDSLQSNLLAGKGYYVIAVQKFRTSQLFSGLNPLEDEDNQFPVIDMIEEGFIRIGETDYFYLYR
jgi:hypothetical protein